MVSTSKDMHRSIEDIASALNASSSNVLGRIRIFPSKQAIVPIEEEYIGDIMAKRPKNSSKTSEVSTSNVDEKAIDAIWKHMGLGHIDISYACVGYSMDGRPILNYDDFMNLLLTYGFGVNDVIAFIDDFANHSLEDKTSPIVMFTSNASAICTSIKPIV